jgi:hypothetical protein
MRFPSQTLSQPTIIALRAVCLILLASSLSYGQRPAPASSATPIPPPQTVEDRDDRRADFGNPEAEMRAKLAIKADKKDYEENLARAREVSDLATQIMQSYQTSKAVTSEDNKKLDRLEKLTKRIRNEAGGSESDAEAKDLPRQMDDAVKCIADLAGELKKLVEKTPRHVVSAAVIDQANKLLGVVQYIRSLGR